MKQVSVFILSAGMGTRMGACGQYLPKPLWPLFEKTLLDVHLDFLRLKGFDQIAINVYHLGDCQFADFERKDLEIHQEENLLGVGGGILNYLEKTTHTSRDAILIVNVDQFFLLGQEGLIDKVLSYCYLDQKKHTLFSVETQKSDHYNLLNTDDHGNLTGIVSGDNIAGPTYSGVSLLNVELLQQTLEKNSKTRPGSDGLQKKFFGDVISLHDQSTRVVDLGVKIDSYYDFGTLPQYLDSHYKILSHLGQEFIDDKLNVSSSPYFFEKFLLDSDSIVTEKVCHQNSSYGTYPGERTLDLSGDNSGDNDDEGQIDLSQNKGTVVLRRNLSSRSESWNDDTIYYREHQDVII